MEPRFLKHTPKGRVYSMDNAYRNAIRAGERVLGYVAKGEFIDIGDKVSYRAAYERYLRRLGKIV